MNDAFFRFVVDMGGPGPDKGKGGKYLILGPGQKAPANTNGYFVATTPSKINWLILRGFLDEKGEPDTARTAFQNGLKVYPFAQSNNPPSNTFKNLTDWQVNTIHANDFKFYEELDEVIQREPSEMFSPELLGMASAIGIQKGKPLKKTAQTNPIFANVKAVKAEIKGPETLEISVDTKAKVNEGDYARGGKNPDRRGRQSSAGLGS